MSFFNHNHQSYITKYAVESTSAAIYALKLDLCDKNNLHVN